MVEEQTFTYLVVENDIIVNKCVGTIDISFSDWIRETYPTNIGWKFNKKVKAFIPNDVTDLEFNNIKTQIVSEILEQKNFYDSLIESTHFLNNLSEEKQKEVFDWLSYINKKLTIIESDAGYVMPYHLNMFPEYYSEPFSIRPNIENEV